MTRARTYFAPKDCSPCVIYDGAVQVISPRREMRPPPQRHRRCAAHLDETRLNWRTRRAIARGGRLKTARKSPAMCREGYRDRKNVRSSRYIVDKIEALEPLFSRRGDTSMVN